MTNNNRYLISNGRRVVERLTRREWGAVRELLTDMRAKSMDAVFGDIFQRTIAGRVVGKHLLDAYRAKDRRIAPRLKLAENGIYLLVPHVCECGDMPFLVAVAARAKLRAHLARHPAARPGEQVVKFGGRSNRCVIFRIAPLLASLGFSLPAVG